MKITAIEVIPFETFVDRFSNGGPNSGRSRHSPRSSPTKAPRVTTSAVAFEQLVAMAA